jgi:DNA-binding CsgD family transcriptional regulator
MGAIFGREAELEAIERFLNRITSGPVALVIEGEAGIGKTTLWFAAVQLAKSRSFRVLEARPAESEAKLSYAALADLLGGAFDEMRTALPGPQEQALSAALLRSEAAEPADERTTATALVAILASLAAEVPVLLGIDDVQWLDSASARALEFALRRLPPQLALLLTLRTDAQDVPLGLGRALPDDRLERLVCGPLSLASLHHLIASRQGAVPTRSTLVRLADACGGNPLFALEIARALVSDEGERESGEPLPLPPSIRELVRARVESLPPAARQAVLVAAALSHPTISTLSHALGPDCDALAALLAAEEADILVSEGQRIRFAHPLFASAVYGGVSSARRRQLHRRLAAVVRDREERARHLSLSVTEPDEVTAAAIEHAARQAAMRGAHEGARELFEAARRLTPTDRNEELVRRTLGQAAALHAIGDLAGAGSLAERALVEAPGEQLRGQARLLLTAIEWDRGDLEAVILHLEASLAEVTDHDLRARTYTMLVHCLVPLDPRRALAHAAAAEQLLGEQSEPSLLGSVLINRFFAEALLGRGAPRELLTRGLELESRVPEGSKHPVPVIWFTCADEFDAARARHTVEDTWYRDRGHERVRGERLGYLVLAELHAGRWDLAEQYAERACAAIDQPDPSAQYALAFGWRAFVDAHRGRHERARSTVRPLIDAAEQTGTAWWVAHLLSILGFVEFAAGNHEAADAALQAMHDRFDSIGVVDALLDRSEPFHIESLLALDQIERAQGALGRLEKRGRALPRLWIDATLPRARALIFAAEGDLASAMRSLDDVDLGPAAELPFELACAQLFKGRLLRRLKQRRLAAETLRAGLEIFERLGAPRWAKEARAELARVGPRRRSADQLTATELRVAELAAAGLTNREVAEAAFLSPKTVEANLARIYRKLGIRSRAELGARMVERFAPPEPKP